MLERFVSVVAGTALPFLLVAACAVVLGGADRGGADGERAHRDRVRRGRRRLQAVAVGLLAGVLFAVLRATAVLGSRTAITLPTLVACVLVDVALVVVLALVVRAAPRGDVVPTSAGAVPGAVPAATGPGRRLLDGADAVACAALALAFFRASPDVVLQLTSFVEPGEAVASSTMLLRALGFVLAWCAVALVAVLYRRAGARAPGRVFGWAAVSLAGIHALVHLTSLLQLLHASHRIQLGGVPFRLLVRLVNAQDLVVVVAAAVLLVPLLVAAARTTRPRPLAENPARERLAQARATHTRRSVLASGVGFALVALTLTVGVRQLDRKVTLSEPEPYTVRAGRAVIPVSSVEDGHLHRYAYTAGDGVDMRFLVVRKSGGAFGVVLDACESCGPVGYYEKDGKIICQACDVAMNLATIGFHGGCNPIPLDFRMASGAIEIETATLDALSSVFA